MTDSEPKYITATEAARRLGVQLRTVIVACKKGRIPHIRLFRQVMIPLSYFERIEHPDVNNDG